MFKYAIQILIFGLAASISWQASAQGSEAASDANKAVATVRTDGGVIMLSENNGPFVTAVPRQPAMTDDRLMVSKDSSATVIYNDGCEQKYDKAGVYKIAPDCKRAAGLLTSGGAAATGWTTGQIVATAVGGGAIIGALIERNHCHCNCPPVSR